MTFWYFLNIHSCMSMNLFKKFLQRESSIRKYCLKWLWKCVPVLFDKAIQWIFFVPLYAAIYIWNKTNWLLSILIQRSYWVCVELLWESIAVIHSFHFGFSSISRLDFLRQLSPGIRLGSIFSWCIYGNENEPCKKRRFITFKSDIWKK